MKIMYDIGLARTGGNVSGRTDQRSFLITPAGAAADFVGRLTPDDLLTVSLTNTAVPGGKPSSETPVHRALYSALPWVEGIVHAHPRHVLALPHDVDRWPRLTSSSRWFEGSVIALAEGEPDVPEATRRMISNGTYSDVRYGVALFIPRHGLFVAGKSVQRALYYLNKLEENAHVSLLAARFAQ